MAPVKVARLIGCAEYNDPKFPPLPATVRDVEALRHVLADPTISDLTVDTLIDQPSEVVREQIEDFFADRKPDDLLLLYFSCHGLPDSRGRLFFVTASTRKERLEATGISARWVKEQMDQSRSQRIVLLLDCCYSGAFTRGARRGSAGPNEEILEQLGGRGRVVIAASDRTECAFDSNFTDAVVRGLETGAADLDGDGRVSVFELYQYVHDRVREKAPSQTPTMSAVRMRGQFCVAKNPHVPAPLPAELNEVLTSAVLWRRLWAVDGLQRILAGDHPGGQKRTARQALKELREQYEDRDVQEAAEEAWGKIFQRPRPPTPQGRIILRFIAAGLAAIVSFVATVSIIVPPVACLKPNDKPGNGQLAYGTLFPTTGAYVHSGPAMKAGADMAINDITAAGGIPPITHNLYETNKRDEGNPSAGTAKKSTEELLKSEVDVIIGPATSAVTEKVIDDVVCAGVIMFAPSNTSPMFTEYPDHGLYFRAQAPSKAESAVLGRLVVDDGNSTVVVMSRKGPYGSALRKQTKEVIEKSGGRVLDDFDYDPNSSNFDSEIERIKDSDPQAIVLISFAESVQILGSMIGEGLGPGDKNVYHTNMSNTLAFLVSSQDPGRVAGMRGTLPHAGDEAFVARLRETNPGLRDVIYAAQTYDAVVITALAAAIARTDAPAAIAQQINGVTKTGEKCTTFAGCMTLVNNHEDIDYDGVSGPLEFDESGEPRSSRYVISEIQADGTIKSASQEKVGP